MAATTFTSYNIMAEQVIKALEGRVSSDTRYDVREVIRYLRNIANKLLLAEIRQAWADGERTVDTHYIATYRNQSILTDPQTGECYADIPATYLYLYNHTGIQRVIPVDGEGRRGDALIPISPYEMDIYGTLPAGSLEGLWCYEPDRDKIWFRKNALSNKTLIDIYKTVDITMVSIDLNNIDDDTQIPIPGQLYDDMIRGVLEILLPTSQKPVDIVNEGNPNIVTNGRG